MRIFELPEPDERPGAEFAVGDEKFIALPHMPSGALLNLFYATQSDDLGRKAVGLVGVIRSTLTPEDIVRFDELIYGPREVPLELLEDLATWLVEFYAGRPSTPSSGSLAGSAETSDMSEDGSSATVSD